MSYIIKKSGDEERVFSVLMTEEEVSLFSELLEQKEYARKDYEGLTRKGKKALRERRSNYAKFLREHNKEVWKSLNSRNVPLSPDEKITSLSTGGNFGTKYSLSDNYHVNTPINSTLSMRENKKNHVNKVREEILNASKKGAKELREGVELEFGTKKTKGTGKPRFSSYKDGYHGDISRLDGISSVHTKHHTVSGYSGWSNKSSIKDGLIDHHPFRDAPLSGKGSSFKKRIPNKIKKAGKAAAIGAGVVGAATLGAVAYKKIKKNKDNKNKNKKD